MAEKNGTKQVTLFCAIDQKDMKHEATVDQNGDYVFVCVECKGFTKVPGDTKNLETYFAQIKKDNEGQVSLEQAEREMEEKLARL